ncbi:MAG: DNA repair protein RadC [Proteobacteria bacterium]|nr:MAG: DNA repair protein RadC [Pseudomonadota bacterium]
MSGQTRDDQIREGPKGHRARLRARFLADGSGATPDYELLELLLFYALPRVDTKPLAKALMARYGSLAAVLAAPAGDLRKTEGIGDSAAALLKAVREAGIQLARADIRDRPILDSGDRVVDYCRAALGHSPTEGFRILFLDTKNALIADEAQGDGTVNRLSVFPREVVKRALDLGASALILAHNHPSGDTTPSDADIATTRAIVDAAAPLGIAVHDHIIVSRSHHTSLKASGLM